jgi:hypothetical protein
MWHDKGGSESTLRCLRIIYNSVCLLLHGLLMTRVWVCLGGFRGGWGWWKGVWGDGLFVGVFFWVRGGVWVLVAVWWGCACVVFV